MKKLNIKTKKALEKLEEIKSSMEMFMAQGKIELLKLNSLRDMILKMKIK